MPAAKLSPAERDNVRATYIATGSDADETAKRHGLLRSLIDQWALRYCWPRPRAGKTREQQDATVSARAIIAVSDGVRTAPIAAADAIAASIADNRSASAAAGHVILRRSLERIQQSKRALPVKTMRDLKDAMQIAEPKQDSAPSVTLNLAFFTGPR